MPDQPSFDLQAHSVHSDGSLPAAEVVERAAAAGVELFALTDHDTVDGVPEAAARARELGLRYSPAAELSAVHGGHEDLHVLGYELDVADPDLIATLEDFRGDRARRIEAMADRLRELGFELDDAPLVARREAGKPIGRPHLADAVLAHPANAERLRAEGIAGKDELFPPYLVPGAQAYVARSRPTVAEAIEVIHARRRRRRLGAPVLGRRRARGGARARSTSSPTPGSTASSASTSPTPRSRPGCCTITRCGAGC